MNGSASLSPPTTLLPAVPPTGEPDNAGDEDGVGDQRADVARTKGKTSVTPAASEGSEGSDAGKEAQEAGELEDSHEFANLQRELDAIKAQMRDLADLDLEYF
jgi:hypothetical protein